MGIKVSQMPSTNTLTDNDLIMVVQDNENKKINKKDLQNNLTDPSLTKKVEELENENAYLQNVVKQAFTEKTASGTELTIDNTIEARMEMKLNGNTSQNTTTGKNLLNGKYKNTSTQNGITLKHNNDNSFDITGTATSNTPFTLISGIDQSNLVVGNTYYFYMSEKYDNTNLNVSLITNTPISSFWIANKAYTIEENQKFNNLTLYIPSGVTMNYHNVKFMIVQGSTATSYEPYTGGIASPNPDYPQEIHCVKGNNVVKISNGTEETDYKLNLGNIELNAIDDYKDYFKKEKNKWYLHKEIGKDVVDENNTIAITNPNTSNWYYQITPKKITSTTSQTNQICNYYSNGEIYNRNTNQGILKISSGDQIRIRYGTEDTVANFKTWLASNNIILYSLLATATDTEITDTTLITQLDEISQALSKKGTTIISQSNDDLPFNLDVIALTK